MTNSTASAPPNKPAKPSPDFPLFPLWNGRCGRWAKKIRGRLHYFGSWEDGPDAALRRYLDQKDELHSGRTPRQAPDDVTVLVLCVRFLKSKETDVQAGELSPRSYGDYKRMTKRVVKAFRANRLVVDLRPEDFETMRAGWIRKGWGPVTIAGEIQRVRSLFKYAADAELVDKVIRFGPGFKKPNKKTMRLRRAAKGKQMYEPAEIRRLLKAAGPQLRAMILLAANCGFGNADCGKLTQGALDLKAGWSNFPRPKTGIPRRCKLWPETVKAIKDALAKRGKPRDAETAALVFVTKRGQPWAKENIANPIAHEFKKLTDELDINGERGFYCLRRGFEFVAGDARDQIAVDAIMGHARDDMPDLYRQNAAGMLPGLGVSDARLEAVSKHVHMWLFTKPTKATKPKAKANPSNLHIYSA